MDRRLFLSGLGLTALSACATRGSDAEAAPPPFAKPPDDKPTPARPLDLDRWRDGLAAARLREITRLREYRIAGRFPKNHRILGKIPTFIDERGSACAVGYLMQRSGHTDLAATIAKTDNHVYIEKLGDGPALDWILFSGLTQAECAMIQPSYNWRPGKPGWPQDPPIESPRPIRPIEPDTEQAQLRTHFTAVEQRLLGDTETSLDSMLGLLDRRIRRGASINQIVR